MAEAVFKMRRTDGGEPFLEKEDGEYPVACRTCACNVPTTPFDGNHGFDERPGALKHSTIYMCQVCYSTLLGSALRYPDGGVGIFDMARGLVECTNLILEQLRHPMHVIHAPGVAKLPDGVAERILAEHKKVDPCARGAWFNARIYVRFGAPPTGYKNHMDKHRVEETLTGVEFKVAMAKVGCRLNSIIVTQEEDDDIVGNWRRTYDQPLEWFTWEHLTASWRITLPRYGDEPRAHLFRDGSGEATFDVPSRGTRSEEDDVEVEKLVLKWADGYIEKDGEEESS